MIKILTFLFVSLIGFCLFPLNCMAKDSVAYTYFTISHFPKVQLIIPKSQIADRFYIQSNYQQHVVRTQAAIDEQTLIPALGSKSSAFTPAELVQGYLRGFTEINTFPSSPFKQVKHQIRISFSFDNNHEKILTLHGEQLKKFQDALLHKSIESINVIQP